jgi:hypothetical protein
MKRFYSEFKNEILAVIGIIVPIALAILAKLLDTNMVLGHFAQSWYFYVIATLATYALYLQLRRKTPPFSLYARGGDPNFKNTLDLGHSLYWYMGMGSEELLRDVALEEYLTRRRDSGRPIKSLRFLFLHPDSPHFIERLREVNPHGDTVAILEAKRSYLRTLRLSLASLPREVLNSCEIRYYDEKPIWLLQFFDAERKESNGQPIPTGVILSMHLRHVHARHSDQFVCRPAGDVHLFESYVSFFEAVWSRAKAGDESTCGDSVTREKQQ